MYLIINKYVTAVKVSNFSGHYLRNRSTLDIGVLGYIGIVQHKEHSPEDLSIPPGTPCRDIYIGIYIVGNTKGLGHLEKNLNKYRQRMIIHPEIGSLWSTPMGKCH